MLWHSISTPKIMRNNSIHALFSMKPDVVCKLLQVGEACQTLAHFYL